MVFYIETIREMGFFAIKNFKGGNIGGLRINGKKTKVRKKSFPKISDSNDFSRLLHAQNLTFKAQKMFFSLY